MNNTSHNGARYYSLLNFGGQVEANEWDFSVWIIIF